MALADTGADGLFHQFEVPTVYGFPGFDPESVNFAWMAAKSGMAVSSGTFCPVRQPQPISFGW